jgi:hypothetical protein
MTLGRADRTSHRRKPSSMRYRNKDLVRNEDCVAACYSVDMASVDLQPS